MCPGSSFLSSIWLLRFQPGETCPRPGAGGFVASEAPWAALPPSSAVVLLSWPSHRLCRVGVPRILQRVRRRRTWAARSVHPAAPCTPAVPVLLRVNGPGWLQFCDVPRLGPCPFYDPGPSRNPTSIRFTLMEAFRTFQGTFHYVAFVQICFAV